MPTVQLDIPTEQLAIRINPWRSGAVRPGRRAALGEQLRGEAVLLGLAGLRGVAGAAEALPGGTVELVLATIPAVGGDRRRVAAGLALRDAPERRGGRRGGATGAAA